MTNDESDPLLSFAILEFTGDELNPVPFTELIALEHRRAIRKGDAMGNTKAVTGYLSFGIKHPTRFSSARVDTDLILKAIGHNAIIIRDLVEQQKLEWGILIFEGDDILDGLAGLESALIERAAALCIPVRQKVEY